MSISRLAPARRACALTLRSFSTQSRVRKENVGEELQKRFRTFYEADIAPRTNALVARASANFAELGGRLNHVTGYNEIQELKNTVYTRGAYAHCYVGRGTGCILTGLHRTGNHESQKRSS